MSTGTTKPGRPPIDLDQKVRDLPQHTNVNDAGEDAPIRNFDRRANDNLALIKYVDDHVANQSVYQAVYNRHMALLHRMVLVRSD
ncbi:hypothetical protein LF1_45590 [Rubripirellula obstinata]|uniref:Uncharacterized protein n=1 Tax=Rubripirellula obstinata TaxID=406547 RepID=A0A5B1CLN4_9BACT|nr:hypothetical protein [Rubripirellula obstinata]KAA1261998.1 hypothetical protein LF1_45590 [Rubripirellula obstinata]